LLDLIIDVARQHPVDQGGSTADLRCSSDPT
jgi:hypothetical protein